MLVETQYLVLYRTEPDTDDGPLQLVEFVRVVDGRRDLFDLDIQDGCAAQIMSSHAPSTPAIQSAVCVRQR